MSDLSGHEDIIRILRASGCLSRTADAATGDRRTGYANHPLAACQVLDTPS